ncbi:MAG TPA: VCBS repeat-containing protein, partial [Saprospiraceae bacterium]|nr:VCBS repeat-containing protein [Saprospiraceae bacterium]
NNGDGSFSETATTAMPHTSQFSMGVDIADVNLDGWADILSLDMLPEDPYILKRSLGEDAYNVFQYKIGLGYSYQYTRNCLQINRPLPLGKTAGYLLFSEVALFSGIAATDWSWSPLFMDYDNDGHKDLFVSNGVPRRMNDIDFVKFRENMPLALKGDSRDVQEHELSSVDSMPKVRLPNKFYHYAGALRFEDMTERVAGGLPSFSNGAVYADFDNDGDLDVVTNNIEDEPFLYQNLSRERGDSLSAYLSFRFEGQALNRHGIGAKVLIFKKNGEQWAEEFWPVRGYQSSAHTPLHIGIGDAASVDSVLVVWPDGGTARVTDLHFNSTQTLRWSAGLPRFDYTRWGRRPAAPYLFRDLTAASGLNYVHRENPFVEFNRQPLMPNMASTEGPALAVGDVNADGLEDVFFGSSKRERSALYMQAPGGKFLLRTPEAILQDSVFEDVDAVFADLENDGDLDLVIAAGGNEYQGQEEPMKQRAYLNDGQGHFSRADPFPTLFMTASCVAAADYDGDGLTDFFFGARAIPWRYGYTPKSCLMHILGKGQFEEVPQAAAAGLSDIGLVKNATWADLDSDGDPDLLLALEWGPVTAFIQTAQGQFEKKPLPSGSGWWNFALPFDADGDG